MLYLGSNSYYEVELEDKFDTDDIDFTGNYSATDPSLSLEIVQKTEKTEPEFAGRFFAKIERDGVLEQAILSQENPDDVRVIANTFIYSNAPGTTSQNYWRNTNKGVYPGGGGEGKRFK